MKLKKTGFLRTDSFTIATYRLRSGLLSARVLTFLKPYGTIKAENILAFMPFLSDNKGGGLRNFGNTAYFKKG